MSYLWMTLIAVILIFCIFIFYRISFIRGYKAGARRVIKEWKDLLNEEDFNDRDEQIP